MAFSARQITLVASTATPTLVQGTPASNTTVFRVIAMDLQDPLPVTIKNEDVSAVVYVGGPDVDSTHGQSIAPGLSQTYNLYGGGEIPYVWSSGTPVVSVLCGRQ